MRKPDYDRRVVVTGLGVISPVGNDVDDRLGQPRQRRVRPRPRSPGSTRRRTRHKLAGEVHDFDRRRLDGPQGRPPQRVEHALRRRRRQAGARRLGLRDHRREPRGGRRRLRLGRRRPAADDRQLRRRSTSKGPRTRRADVHRQRARRLAVRDDRDRDRRDRPQHLRRVGLRHRHPQRRRGAPRRSAAATASRSSAGSTEAPLLEVGHAGFSNMRGMGMPRPGEPLQTVSRPFDLTRDGFVLGEGAGVAVPRGPRARQGARRADLRRGRRLRLGGRRLGHDPADRGRRSARPGR